MVKMVKMVKYISTVIAFAVPLFAGADSKSAFETVPKQALVELKATIGKPFTAGLVFVDGKFIPPPYKVERYGTAFRINGQQVTGQAIPWDEFLKTQSGVRIERIESPASAAPAAPVQQVEEASPSYDDLSDDFDDLFDDDPKPKKKKSAPSRPVVKKPAAPPPPATKVVFDGVFEPNQRTKAMVIRLNKMRTNLEVFLRKGGACFFGSRYSTVRADRAPADMFLQEIPRAMKDSSGYEAFASTLRSRGITFLPDSVLRDLFRNRLDYVKLQERARSVKDERKWESMLNNVAP